MDYQMSVIAPSFKNSLRNYFHFVYGNTYLIITIGIWLRFFVMTMGNMEDYNNFNDASKIFLANKNIYLDSPNFNWPYSTLFLQTLSWFQFLTQFASNLTFRFVFVTFLIIVDIAKKYE